MRTKLFLCIFLLSFTYTLSAASDEAKDKRLKLSEALQLAVSSNYRLSAMKQHKEAAEGNSAQAGLLPNPELSIGFDEFGGTGDYKSTSSLKSTIGISQEILTAGKQSKRINAAKKRTALAETEIKKAEVELMQDVFERFLAVYRLEQEVKLQKQSLQNAKDTAETVKKRTQAGEAPAIDETRALADLSAEEFIQKHLQRNLKTALLELAASWNSEKADFNGVELDESLMRELKPEVPSEELLLKNSEYIAAEAETEVKKHEKILAEAEVKPNLTLSLAASKYRENDDKSYEAELAVPLQIFDRGRGTRKSAAAELKEAQLNLQAVKIEILTRYSSLHEQIESLRDELQNAETSLLPAAQKAYDETKKAYDAGERELISLLDARKSLLTAAKIHLQLRYDYFMAAGEYMILTGSVDALSGKTVSEKEDTK